MLNHQRKVNKIQDIIKQHIKNNIKEYLLVSIIFIIGIILGTVFINYSNAEQRGEIQNYINTFTSGLNSDIKIDISNLLIDSIKNNMIMVLALWFVGSTVVGIPIVFIFVGFKGFTLGYTISSIMITFPLWKGILFVICTLLLQNIIFIPCLLSLAVSGIKLYKSIVKNKRKENIKIEILRHTLSCITITIMLILSSLIETYISSNLLTACISIFT